MSSADVEAHGSSSAQEAATPSVRGCRSQLGDGSGGGDGALLPHGAIHSAGVGLQCTLRITKKKQQFASWRWKQDPEFPIGSSSADTLQTATGGIGFRMYVTAKHELFCSGMARCVQYEDVRVCGKKRSSAHPSCQQFKSLLSRERELFRGCQSRQEDDTATDSAPCRVSMLASAKCQVHQVSCGISHCIALTGENGECDSLFAWGIGMYGQLGLGDQQVANTMTPIHTSPKLQGLLSAAQVSREPISEIELRCGPFATYLFVKHTSIVWHWGLLPSSDSTTDRFVRQGVPVEFPMIDEDVEITDIAVGVEHVVVLSSAGRVFTWGYGASGQLGLGHETVEIVHENAQPVDFLHSGVTVTAVVSGWNHTIALASDRSVFAWGSNRLGACGATTRFHEYFSPVRVSMPQNASRAATMTGSDVEECRYTISCCGSTSILTTRHSGSGVLETAFVWGVCSHQVAALAPTEIPDVRYHGCFTDCKAGFGIVHGIYTMNSMIYERADPQQQHHSLLHIQNESSASEPISFDLELDDAVSLKLVALLDHSNTTRARYSEDRLRAREVRLSTAPDSRQIVHFVSTSESEQACALDIQLKAVSPGTTQIKLLYDGNVVFGCPIEVRVRLKQRCERRAADPSDAPSVVIEACAMSVIGRNDQGHHHQQQLALVGLKWKPVNASRVRIYDDDTLVLLIQGAQTVSGSMLRLQDEFGKEFDAEISVHGYSAGSRHEPSALAAATIQFPGIGVYSIIQVDPRSATHLSRSDKLVEVVCVMNRAAKSAILAVNASFLKKQIDHATNSAGSARASFSTFVSTLLRNKQLRGALVNTPFVSTADMEMETIWDFDCEFVDREALCANCSDPLVLWRKEQIPPLSGNSGIDHADEQEGQLSFWDVLPRWTLDDPAVVEFSLTPVRPMPAGREHDTSSIVSHKASQDDLKEKARIDALRIGLSVQQSPLEFLVHGTLVTNSSTSSSPAQHFTELKMTEVAAWRDQHGELFYTPQPLSSSQLSRASFAIHVYGHESHHFPETATGSLLGTWKTKLHAFLWELLNQAQGSLEALFQRFVSASLAASNNGKEEHIRLRDFVSTLGGLGFATTNSCYPEMSLSKQEWLTLFTEIQSLAAGVSSSDSFSLSSSPPARVTRSVFKTLLIDPFHQSLASPNAIARTLLEQFRPPRASDHGSDSHIRRQYKEEQQQDDGTQGTCLQFVPWSEFVEHLHRFHDVLSRIHNREDQVEDQQDDEQPVLSLLDCYRILYRFDLQCNGWISVRLFHQSVIASLRETNKTSKKNKAPSYDDGSSSSEPLKRGKQRTAVRNAKRPDVDAFSTPSAVQKLFLTRAQKQQEPHDGRHLSSNSIRNSLVHAGNTHLARIRSLPVSKLLR